MRLVYVWFLLLFSVFSCKNKDADKKVVEEGQREEMSFTILTEAETNISFKNLLKEGPTMNGLVYEYFYNGAGVAVGDVNGDELMDIYFVSNLKSNKLYLNQGNMKFSDVTDVSGTKGKYGFPTGVTTVDINADGKLDIYICKSGKFNDPDKRRNELYINQGNNELGIPTFKEQAKDYGLDIPYFSTQASFFDFDRDGDLDMFLLNHGLENYPDEAIETYLRQESKFRGERLYENQNEKFVDITSKAGIINNMLGFGLGLSIGDINNDGWPDVVVGHDYSEKEHIYINQKNGTFKEVVEEVTNHISNFSMGNDIADYNNDGLLDIVSLDMMSEKNYDMKTSMSGMNPKRFYKHVNLGLHYQYMYNTLQLNNGRDPDGNLPQFSDVAQMAGVSSTDWSWGPLLFDMDNDGLKDLFISNGIKRDFRNNDFNIYRKKKQEEVVQLKKEGKNFDQKAFVLDLLSKMPPRKKVNYFYHNNGDLTFSDKSSSWAKNLETSSNGAAYADLDNDGDLDIVVNNADDTAFIYRNNAMDLGDKNYLQIHLEGEAKNAQGVGARLIAFHDGKKQVLEQYFTRGFQSSVSDRLHFGLGDSQQLDSLMVIWPRGKAQTLTHVKSNQILHLKVSDAKDVYDQEEKALKSERIFETLSNRESGIQWKHIENDFDDFKIETLLPHRMSRLGPGVAVGDIDGDGLEDFYIGGAMGQAGVLYTQNTNGKFDHQKISAFERDKQHEDTGALFFDADGDGDQDLYVVSGGYEKPIGDPYYQDRLYENLGNGEFKKQTGSLPKITESGLRVVAGDFDSDGDLDLFVGTRVKPSQYGAYTKSYLLENKSEPGNLLFEDVTEQKIPEMLEHPMVTDALWADMDKDEKLDLVVANEWGAIEIFSNLGNSLTKVSAAYGLDKYTGWWYSITVEDLDGDGYPEILAGNLGQNYKYKASQEAPFYMYVNDFDDNTTNDIVLGYTQDSTVFPLRGRQCSSDQMPFIKKKFKTYDAFAKADIIEVYGEKLNEGLRYKATTFASGIFKNDKGEKFTFDSFENRAQLSSVNAILVDDCNNDGIKDLLLLGNMYGSEVETPRNDASYGLFLKGSGNGKFITVPPSVSGLYAEGDIKDAALIHIGNKDSKDKAVLVVRNNNNPSLVRIQ